MKLTIDGRQIETASHKNILETAKECGIFIPSLCYCSYLKPYGGCRLCIVEIDGMRGFPTACTTYVEDGMNIRTNTERLKKLRKEIFELILTEHSKNCTTCVKNLRCELQNLAAYFGLNTVSLPYIEKKRGVFSDEPFFNRDYNLCILCGRCVRVCEEVRRNSAVDFLYRGIMTTPGTAYDNKSFYSPLKREVAVEASGVDGRGVLSPLKRGVAEGQGVSPSFSSKKTSESFPLQNSNCEFCGACVDICPTAALIEKDFTSHIDRTVTTICPYCGVGCSTKLEIKDEIASGTAFPYNNTVKHSLESKARKNEKIVRVIPDIDGPANKGQLCVKGRFGIKEFVHHSERITKPLVKKAFLLNVERGFNLAKKEVTNLSDESFIEISWDDALTLIAERFLKYKGEQFAVIASAKCTNEDNYVIQKFARAVMKTNNIDHCARLCHAPSVVALAETLGSGAMTNSIQEIADAKTILSIGSNSTATHPVIALQIKKAVSCGAKLIVINPKKIELCRFAYLWLQHKPGTDVALLNGMAKVIITENLHDFEFIKVRCEDYDEYFTSIKKVNLDEVEEITGVKKENIIKAARIYATQKPSTILYGMGVTQHSNGTNNVFCISNLALITGNIGKPSTGINPLRGQNNVQGACDMGLLPGVYPGYQKVEDAAVREKFEKFYQTELNPRSGLTITEMLNKAHNREIKAMYIIGANPVLSAPCSKYTECSLGELEFLVVQDMFLTETAKLADVVLPACSFAEKDGTFTNSERRIQLIRKAIEPIGESRSDWEIVCEIAKRMRTAYNPLSPYSPLKRGVAPMKSETGCVKVEDNPLSTFIKGEDGFDFSSPSEIMDEISKVTPIYGGVSYKRLEKQTLKWPCPDENHPGTDILHIEKFTRGKGKLKIVEYEKPAEVADDEFPFILTTERSLYHYHSGSMTRKVDGLNKIQPEEKLEINPFDAQKLNISDGEFVKVISRRAEVQVKTKITDNTQPGVLSLSFHFAETPTNTLFDHTKLDPFAKMPNLKVCAVKIERITTKSV